MNAIRMLPDCMRFQNSAILLPYEGSCAPRESTPEHFDANAPAPTDNGVDGHRGFGLEASEPDAMSQTGLEVPVPCA